MAFNIGIFVLFLLALYVSKMLSSGSLREAMAKRFESPPVLTARWNVPGTVKFYIGLLRAAGTGKVHVFMKSIFSTASEGCGYEVKTVLLGRPWGYRILTCDTENIHAVLTTKFQDFSTGSRKQALEPGLGRHSIVRRQSPSDFVVNTNPCQFGSDGEAWKKSRHYIRSALSRERISDTSVVHRNTASLISVLATTPGPIDVQPLFLEHAMRTSTEFLGIGSSESNEAWDDRGFSQAVEVANLGITKRVSLDSFYWLYDTTAFRRACKLAHNVVMTSVRKVLASEEDMGEHGRSQFPQKEKRNLLEELVTETRDEERLLSMALDVLSASRQTTTSLLSSLVYYLAQHPTTYSKLRSEIVQTFGAVETDTLMTFEQLKRCQYLQWCINETLRLVPPAPFGAMTAAVDTILPTGGGAGGKSPIFVKKVSSPSLE